MFHIIGDLFSAYWSGVVGKIGYFGQFMSVFEDISVSFLVAFVLRVSQHV